MLRETRNLTKKKCAQAVVLREEGWTYTRIAEKFGVSHTSVSRILQRFRNVRRQGQSRPRVTTAIQERYLRVSSLRQRFSGVYKKYFRGGGPRYSHHQMIQWLDALPV